MTFSIEEMPKQRIAYIRHVGPYGINNKAVMEKLKEWAKSNALFKEEAIILGIAWDDVQTTPPEKMPIKQQLEMYGRMASAHAADDKPAPECAER